MTALRNPPGTRPIPGPGSSGEPARAAFPALGTTAVLLTADPARADRALAALRAELAAIDAACSRFRPDSELSRANAAALSAQPPTGTATGSPVRPVPVGPLLAEALEVALRAAALTGGAVDPTVGPALVALGYDRTFAQVARTGPAPVLKPATGWRNIGWDPALRVLRLPAGTTLDLGATAKALAADRAARRAALASGCGVLVNLGGDLATAGPAPRGGWRIAIADDHAAPARASDPVITVRGGAIATSGLSVRSWQRGGRARHHIIDPATGDSAPEVWRTVSVAAATCVDANTAATAAMVLGERAVAWLRGTGLPARLVRTDGSVVRIGEWPAVPGGDGPADDPADDPGDDTRGGPRDRSGHGGPSDRSGDRSVNPSDSNPGAGPAAVRASARTGLPAADPTRPPGAIPSPGPAEGAL